MEKKQTIRDLITDEERALFGRSGFFAENCRFEGPADGEFPLLECEDATLRGCYFALRYPLWHNRRLTVVRSRTAETCSSAFWYGDDVRVGKSVLRGEKPFRACRNLVVSECDIDGDEFGWNCSGVTVGGRNSRIRSGYALLGAEDVHMRDTTLTGPDAFLHVRDGEIRDCVINSDGAFWHTEKLTLTDCVLNGDRLGWYAKDLKLVRCRISGAKPFRCCERLVLEDCSMDGCTDAFEYSDVDALLTGRLAGVRNPLHGSVTADAIESVIMDDARKPGSDCVIRTRT